VADFGLSKDKELDTMKQTVKMTGCGSSLWMVSLHLLAAPSHRRSIVSETAWPTAQAPEILLARPYNESVDVYSYAMCLVELVDRNLPWAGRTKFPRVPTAP
jgi:serine/threonine protein kinase